MKRKSMLMLLFASLTLLTVSCGKDDTDSDGSSGNISGMPTFANLYSYIGRTDIDAIKSEFTSSGYSVWMEEEDDDIHAEKSRVDSYNLDISGGKVTGAWYDFDDNDGKTKSLLLSKIDEEKKFRSQSGLTQYRGGYLDRSHNETSFSSKDEFISALQNLDLSTVEEGWNYSTYSDVKTGFYFGGNNGFSYGVRTN